MLQKICINIINIYQGYLRPGMPASCRFSPSCSEYAKQAIMKYGFCKGILKAAKRLLACHPFSRQAGYDPLV